MPTVIFHPTELHFYSNQPNRSLATCFWRPKELLVNTTLPLIFSFWASRVGLAHVSTNTAFYLASFIHISKHLSSVSSQKSPLLRVIEHSRPHCYQECSICTLERRAWWDWTAGHSPLSCPWFVRTASREPPRRSNTRRTSKTLRTQTGKEKVGLVCTKMLLDKDWLFIYSSGAGNKI